MISQVTLTNSDVNTILVFLAAILAVLGWIGRQQIKWMSRIEDKINNQHTEIAVIKAVMGIQHKDPTST